MQQNAETETDELESVVNIDEAEGDEVSSSVYEIGYHMVPNLSEEEVTAAVAGIMEILKKNGAAFVGDRFPSKIPLAYAIPKRVTGKVSRFIEAYFGWVAFESPREAIAKIKESLDT
ncbi:MAG: 30S ribosomal protein S6, partial [bacterium]|nr:30S ribosomal protein S6 [bacterium]